MLADSHPNIVVSFQVNDENLMWSILLSYIYLVALLASHVWSVPFKKAPFYFSSISVAIHYLLYYNFLLGILHYAAYVCKTDLWSLLCTGSFIGEALQDIWEMLNEFTSDLSTESYRQELFFCCWTARYTGEFWWTGSIFLYMMSLWSVEKKNPGDFACCS